MAEEKKTSEKAEEKEVKKAPEKKDAKKASAKKPAKKNRKNPFKSVVAFFKSVKAEGKKVVWAKPKDVLKNTIIVLIVVFIVGLAIFAVDSVLTKGMSGIKELAAKEETTTEAVVDDADTGSDLLDGAEADADAEGEEETDAAADDGAEDTAENTEAAE